MRHNYSLIQRTSTISIDELIDISTEVLEWCEKNMGINKNHKKEHRLILSHKDCHAMGKYYTKKNVMKVFLPHNRYLRDVIKTIIHEYTHVLQPIAENYDKSLPRNENPYEIEADANELKYYRTCWKEIKKKFRKK